jgi:MFS transporter, AAHS family, benzoate transport protein
VNNPTQVPATVEQTEVIVHQTPRLIMGLCGVALLLEGYDIYVFSVALPGLLARPDWRLSPAFAGVIGSGAAFGMLIGSLLVGLLTDLLGRRRMVIGAVTVFSLGMALSAAAPTPQALLAFRILVGIGCGGFMPTALSTIVEYSTPRRRNFNVSLGLAGAGLGGVAVGVSGIWLMPLFGYQCLFAVGAIAGIVLLPLILTRLPESISYLVAASRIDDAQRTIDHYRLPISLDTAAPRHRTNQHGARQAVLSLFSPRFLGATVVFSLGTVLCMILNFGTNTWLPTLMIKAGYGLQSSLSFLVALNLGVIAGSLIASRFADRSGPKPLVLLGFASAAVSLALLALHPPLLAVYVLVVLVGFGAAGTQNLINSYSAIYYPAFNRGSGLGVMLGVGRIGGIIGPAFGGILVAHGLTTSQNFLAFVVPAILALTVMSFGPAIPGPSSANRRSTTPSAG